MAQCRDPTARIGSTRRPPRSGSIPPRSPARAREPPPDNAILGPIRPRGAPNGIILRYGRRVASWGDTRQIDQTFSVAKSYLGILAGLIGDRAQPVASTVRDGGFEGPQNGAITWRQLLQQTSEWEGTLWDKA